MSKQKGLIALNTVLGNYLDKSYTSKGFEEIFDHFSEDKKIEIVKTLYEKLNSYGQISFLNEIKSPKTHWDWLKYRLDKFWSDMVNYNNVDAKIWTYKPKSVEELKKIGFDIDHGKCSCSSRYRNKDYDPSDCDNPRSKLFWLVVKNSLGYELSISYNFRQRDGDIYHVMIYNKNPGVEFEEIHWPEEEISRRGEDIDECQMAVEILQMPKDKFKKTMEQYIKDELED